LFSKENNNSAVFKDQLPSQSLVVVFFEDKTKSRSAGAVLSYRLRFDFCRVPHRIVVISNFPTMVLAAMADLVRVKEKFQITIPVGLRRQLAVHEGDYLEATVTPDGIVFRPQRLVKANAPRVTTILDFIKERQLGGRTREEIDASLAADRDSWDK
jgi:AbrB family looped-hinge helix DNA binding protein